ncbi:MAG: type II toxin-antitoxin system mRNA interferase toxin, RelE/StbE family [Cyanobacteria bacterium P01_D01_bin.116]
MNYELEFTEESVTDLEKLTQIIQIRIINKINWLAENFEQLTPQTLTGDFADFYKLRVGDYRVI